MTAYEQGKAAAQQDKSRFGERFVQDVAADLFPFRHEEWAQGYRENK